MTVQRRLAKTILESILEESEARSHYSINSMLVRLAGNAAIVLGFEELTKGYASLLECTTVIGTGQASNLSPRRHFCKLDSLAENDREYPIFPENYTTHIFQIIYHKMLPCPNIGVEELLKEAKTENNFEDIAVIHAILGRYDEAMDTCQSLLDPHRQQHVRYIICIEHYRRDHIQEAQSVHSSLTGRILTTSAGAQFALGVCNRVPWRVYPFSDI